MKRFVSAALIACLLLTFAAGARPAGAAMEFIPQKCEAILAIHPAVLLDPAGLADPKEKLRFAGILAEIGAKVGFDLLKEVDTAGFCLEGADKFLSGQRPQGFAFATGRFDPARIVKLAGVDKPQKIQEFEVYPVGDGIAFGFAGKETLLFGTVDAVVGAQMAARKSALSGAAKFKALAGRIADPATAFCLTLAVTPESAAALKKMAVADFKPELLLAGLSRIDLHYGKSGAGLALVGANPAFVAAARPVIEALLKKAAEDAAAELAAANRLPATDPTRADTLAGVGFTHGVLSGIQATAENDTLVLSVPGDRLAAAGNPVASLLLRTFNANYAVGKGDDGVRRCLGNMRALEGAADLRAQEKKGDVTPLTVELLVKENYLSPKMPACPLGGTYSLQREKRGDGEAATLVTCSAHGSMDAIYGKLYDPEKLK